MTKGRVFYKIVLTHITTLDKYIYIKNLKTLTEAYHYAKFLETRLGSDKWVTTKIELLYE